MLYFILGFYSSFDKYYYVTGASSEAGAASLYAIFHSISGSLVSSWNPTCQSFDYSLS
jgi:hypothetical protein